MQAIEAHVEEHIGKISWIMHEIISEKLHIDILVVEPAPERDYYALLSMGMSALPMNIPGELDISPFSELMICLPPDWVIKKEEDTAMPSETEDLAKNPAAESNYWPIRWLKILAHLPIDYDTWLGYGHSIPAEELFAENTHFNGLLLSPSLEDEDFFILKQENGKEVYFWNIVPIFEEEMQFKLENGADALFELFDQFEVSHIVDIVRENVATKVETDEDEHTRPN